MELNSEAYKKAIAAEQDLIDSQLDIPMHSSISTTKIKFDGDTEKAGMSDNTMHDRVSACREMYENVGIIGNIIDIMIDFALEGIKLVHASKPIENFYRNWQRKVMIRKVSGEMLKCIFRDGNVPVYSIRGMIASEEVLKFKKAYASARKSEGSSPFIDSPPDNAVIPYKYRILDIININKSGSELLGTVRYSYSIPNEELSTLKNPITESEKTAVSDLKQSMTQVEWDLLTQSGQLILDADRLTMLYYKKDSFRKWASPLLWRVVDDVKFKKLLRDMDISVAENVINTLTIIKLGKTELGFAPTKKKFDKLADMLKNPAKSKTIIWDDLIDIIAAYPPVDQILGREKYEQVDNDIRSGLGIAEILVNGAGANYANSYLSVKTLLERLESARDTVIEFWDGEVYKIAKAMKFRSPAIIQMDHMSLTDENTENQFILELYDRNLVSGKSVVEKSGRSFAVEVKQMGEEDDIRTEARDEPPFALLKTGKFGPQYQDATMIPVKSKKKNNKKAKPIPSGQGDDGDEGGRPTGTKKKINEPKKVKPIGGKASVTINPDFIVKGLAIYDKLFEMFYDEKADIEKVYDSIDRVMSCVDDVDKVTKENIVQALSEELATAPAKLERCVKEVKKKKIAKFIKDHKRRPNKKEMREITSSAWAICRSALNM